MEFLKKVGSTAESLLDQVDQKTAEISKDVRSGGRAARRVAERLEKRERINITEGGLVGSEVAKQIERLQADLDAAGEVLHRSQQLAAERELKVMSQLERERSDRENREEELMIRIRQLESSQARLHELEVDNERLQVELEESRGSRDHGTVELQEQAERARADAEHARAALATAMKDSEARTTDLERTNLALVRELAEIKAGLSGSSPASGANPTLDDERNRHQREVQELEDRLVAAEDKRSSLEMQIGAERARAERLEAEIRKVSQSLIETKDEHAKHIVALEAKMAGLKRDTDEARAEAETHRRSNMDNGRDALEKRLESLSSHLELKQRQIDSLRSEKRSLEQKVAEVTPSLPTFRPRALTGGATGGLVQGEMKGRFARFKVDSAKHKNLARALDAIDGLALSAAAIMRSQPFARLGFVAYVVLLHFWVFHVITWTSTTPPSHATSAGPGNLRGSSNIVGPVDAPD